MATLSDEIRSVNRVVRTEGKNITKLKKIFDQVEKTTKQVDVDSHQKSGELIALADSSENMSNRMTYSESNSFCNNSSVDESFNDGTGELCGGSTSPRYNNNNHSDSRSDIPFCRKVPKGSLWENVDIGHKTVYENALWESSSSQLLESSVDNLNNTVASTAELHSLIATSRSELSKMRDQTYSDKSNLESYFTSFENGNANSFEISSSNSCDIFPMDQQFFTYDCDINNMSFEDDETALSDVSSDEELGRHPALCNTNYLPAYALHTIIEESCEESERDSLNATPTNNAETSKLERYFSWDIINDAELNMRKKEDDESTVYSDSLSEGSVGQSPKEIDPTQLVSSCLEKYFMSGLVDNEIYNYPDDAEFSEDPPVSDFEEDSVHQKISRSALLSSLETNPSQSNASKSTHDSFVQNELSCSVLEAASEIVPNTSESTHSASLVLDKETIHESTVSNCDNNNESTSKNILDFEEMSESKLDSERIFVENKYVQNSKQDDSNPFSPNVEDKITIPDVVDLKLSPLHDHSEAIILDSEKIENNSLHLSNKQQITVDIQSVIQKLLSHFAVLSLDPLKENIETDYKFAYQILESEVERLLNTISPSALEHSSCNSSMVDSNNSDYGSDTIESVDCITDDECSDSKSRLSNKWPLVDILKPYNRAECDLNDFNISDETLGIWRRLIQSLQKDNAMLAKNRSCDPNAEARLYIKNQIVTLMHTVTVNDTNISEVEKSGDLFNRNEKEIFLNGSSLTRELNEAYNVNIANSCCLTPSPESDSVVQKFESSDEGISSTDSNENIYLVNSEQSESTDLLNCEKSSSKIELTSLQSNKDNVLIPLVPVNKDQHEAFSVSESDAYKKKPPRKNSIKDTDIKFNVIVDIKLDDELPSADSCQLSVNSKSEIKTNECAIERSEIHHEKDSTELSSEISSILSSEKKTLLIAESQPDREVGYFSYGSCDDSVVPSSSQTSEFVDVPNFKSLKRSIKKFPPPSSTLSKSTSNILQSLSTSPDPKFGTLQFKSKRSKTSDRSPSRQFTSLFSPSSVFKRFTGSKANDCQANESSIPAKYLKKYAKSAPVNENLIGAVSMPHLNTSCKPGDSYSALGLYSENDPDNSLTLDDEVDAKRYFSGSQSVLSLGAHSASMTSVYSAGGCHYGYVTVSGDVLFGLNYNQKSQMMEVFVKQCRNLASVDLRNNKSNPYVKVYLLPDKTRSGKRKTKTKKSTLNPVFNELLRFPVLKNELESRTLWLSVWNSDLFGRNDFLGEISLPLGYRLLDSPTLRWYPLQERMESLTSPLHYRGELFIALKYVPRDLSLESRFRPAPVISQRGALHVLVKEARNISTNRSSLDAFCKSYLLPDKSKSSKQKTPIVKRSRHPKWYYTVIYEDLSVDDLRERSLELTVWDHDKISSNNFMGGLRLNTGSGLYHGVSVEWMDARRDESSLWHAMLQSPNMWVDGCLPLRPTLQSRPC